MAGFIGKFFSLLSGSPKHGDSDTAKSPYMPVEKSPLDFTFAEAFTQSGGYFIYCSNKQDVIDQLRNVGLESGEQALFVPEIALHHWAQGAGLSVIKDNPLEANAMLTTCHAAIAKTGGVMISDAQTQGLKFAQLPAIHIVFGSIKQVVNGLTDGMIAINKFHKEQRPLSIITLKGKQDDSVAKAKIDPNKNRELYFFLLEDHLMSAAK